MGATSTEKLTFSYCPSKRGWLHPWPSKNCPWFTLPTDPAVVLESVRCELKITQQGKAVRAPALALVAGTGRHVLGAQSPYTKSSPALRSATNWPGAACGGPPYPSPWCEWMLLGHCELLLLQTSSPSLPGTFSLERYLGLHLSILTRHFTRCQMPAQALNQQCPCRVFIYLLASRLKLLAACLSLLHKGQGALTLHLWVKKAGSKLASHPSALSALCHVKLLQPFEFGKRYCQLITAQLQAQQAAAGRAPLPRLVPLRSRHWVQLSRKTW